MCKVVGGLSIRNTNRKLRNNGVEKEIYNKVKIKNH